MSPDQPAPVDVVYTWVDDSFPGYADTLRRHAGDSRDTNPNRTRDNLELLRFSMRSLERHAPFVRRVYLLTCRPQVPDWIERSHPDLVVVHHDEIMSPAILPTFNSFAIVSHLAKLPDLSPTFLYFEDDMLLLAPLALASLTDAAGRLKVFGSGRNAPVHSELRADTSSPWNLALATANAALDATFSSRRRPQLLHSPLMIDRALFEQMCATFPAGIEATRRSRFRANGNLPPEYLYPHYLLETGRAVLADVAATKATIGYASLENWLAWTWLQLVRLDLGRPVAVTLNDSFNERPNPRVVAHVRKTLKRWLPQPSRFERADRPPE